MIELAQHIESLLMQNGCVIVPSFGAFVSQHIPARYEEGEHAFYPPCRSVGFNAQLTTSDGMLAHTYMEDRHLTYAQAETEVRREVDEMAKILADEGSYELEHIGVLHQQADGMLEFSPCEAGLLSPIYYGLETCSILPLSEAKKMSNASQQPLAQAETTKKTDKVTIHIRRQWLYNAAAVAAVLLIFFLFAAPRGKEAIISKSAIFNQNLVEKFMCQLTAVKEYLMQVPTAATVQSKPADVQPQPEPEPEFMPDPDTEPVDVEPSDPVEETAVSASVPDTETVPEPQPQEEEPVLEEGRYCIVLASAVTERNANYFAKQLRRKGFDEVRVAEMGKMRRVVYSSFKTEASAFKRLYELRKKSDDFETAWVYKIAE